MWKANYVARTLFQSLWCLTSTWLQFRTLFRASLTYYAHVMRYLNLLLPTPTQSRGYGFYLRLSVCLSFVPHDISKTNTSRTTKLDVQMFHNESRKPIYLGVKRSNAEVTSHKNIADVGLCTLVSAGFFILIVRNDWNSSQQPLNQYRYNWCFLCSVTLIVL